MFYPPRRVPLSVLVCLGALILGFLIIEISPHAIPGLFGLIPARVIGDFWLWQMVTYLGLHGSLLHLLFNMLNIYLFGIPLCEHWGEKKWIAYFLICGFGAAVATLIVMPGSLVPTIGASGAIYGLLYAWAKEFPDSVIYLYGLVPVRAKHFVVMLAALELVLSQSPSPIARFAHLGGLATGWLYFRTPDLSESLRSLVKRRSRFNPRAQDQEEVDRILEKISEEGMDALTARERDILDRASRRQI